MSVFQQGNKRASKLTSHEVQEMRFRYRTGKVTQGQLARDYKITIVQVGRIIRHEVWHDVPDLATEEELAASAKRLLELQNTPTLADRLAADIQAEKEKAQAGDKMLGELADIPVTQSVQEQANHFLGKGKK